MNKSPLVTIITPSYNQGHFIEDTIKSIINQDYTNIEHIVMDGVSTDNTLDILKKYEKQYNLKWVSEPDDGQTDALNKGFEMAQGEIVCWLNSDDVYFDKTVISKVVGNFEKYGDVGIIYGDGVFIDENGQILSVYHAVPWFSFNRLRRYQFFFQPSSFFRKKVVKSHKLDVTINLPMDHEYYLRLVKAGFKFKHVNEILSGYRVHMNTKTKSLPEDVDSELRDVQKKYGQQFNSYYYFSRYFDKIISAILMIYGMITIIKIHKNFKNQKFAFPAKLNSLSKAVKSQLFGWKEIMS
ncbi:MAG: glycosyltransferase [Methanobacterium sp.]|uniref:glycosyltransferase family 2 protein n=1 Tax=Methanobacterium sp. TaxID=2164 RepID=UPI003D65E909|nr:glycosyltransferase [Methanobacterium sp.]